ncbi:MAG: ACP S-malonyltransferase [Spirochaetales bacterium]|nr:ACP S-malonyltransferase [Spirochaetales bacterium]
MKTAFLFPGQGAQYPGMVLDLYDASSEVRDLFALAQETTGVDVHALLAHGTEEQLKETVNTQISVTLANLSAAVVLRQRGVIAQGVAGFSLGEYAALAWAGVLPFEKIFPLVRQRGEFMAQAAQSLDRSAGEPGMAAVLGLSPEQVDAVLTKENIPSLFAANYNSPVQVVISGTAEALKSGEAVLKAAGAKRIIRLKVSGPFHSPLLKSAAQSLEQAVNQLSFADPQFELYSNVTGAVVRTGSEAKALAVRQVTSPVRWTAEEAALATSGYTRVIEAGPGTVLAGLWKALFPEADCLPAGKLEQIAQIG